METLWFIFVCLMISIYIVLDGFDFGAAVIQYLAAKTDTEKNEIIVSIGPVWDGNEVWLVAGGGTLFFAFPALYSSAFSGFYLPLMLLLWLLMFRAIAIEFRSQIKHPMWVSVWDRCFQLSSLGLIIALGLALGNLVRGVPLGQEHWFFLPLWTDFQTGPEPGIIDWYTALTALCAVIVITMHGALWVVMKTENELNQRALQWAQRLWLPSMILTPILLAVSLWVQPHIYERLSQYPAGWLLPILSLGALGMVQRKLKQKQEVASFLFSCLYLLGMLLSVAFGMYPFVLVGTNPEHSLTISQAATTHYGLTVGLAWWIPGMLLVTGYFIYLYRNFWGKVDVERDGH